MNLSKDAQDSFTEEIGFVVGKMKDSTDLFRKLYFFSAVHGMAFRIMNSEFDPELAFIHNVLSTAHNMINVRLTMSSQGQERAIGIPNTLFQRLEEALEEMAAKIEKGEETYPVLQTISNLAYSTTGNGYYLHLKGVLPI